MPKKTNKPYDKFMELLLTLSKKERRWRWSRVEYSDEPRVLEYWKTLSNKHKKDIVSDSRWNHYPGWTYSNKDKKKGFGAVFENLVKAFCYNENDRKILTNYSQGIFAIIVLDSVSSEERIKMSKRLIDSRDQRVRSRVVSILPVNIAKKMLTNQVSRPLKRNVQTKLITRIGFDNCYKQFLPKDIGQRISYLERRALGSATRSDLEPFISKLKAGTHGVINDLFLTELVKRLTPEEAMFFLGGAGGSKRVESAIKRIFEVN
jgi:hypothetical protein